MKRRSIISFLGVILIVILTFAACASKERTKSDSNVNFDDSTAVAPEITTEEAKNGTTYGTVTTTDTASGTSGETSYTVDGAEAPDDILTNSSSVSAETSGAQTQDKIIRRFEMGVETQDFDVLIKKINSEIKRLEGYVESSELSGKGYLDNNNERYGNIIARIPKNHVDEFVNVVDDNANVIHKQEASDNVTLKYVDIESRKKALEIEQERLFVLLEKTDTLENIITLESRLSDIRYELQNYETQLRSYDNQVEYSTVTLNIQEVERITPISEKKESVWSRMHNGFSDSMYHLSEGFKNFFVWFVVNLPYLILWAVILAVAAILIRKYYRKYAEKSSKSQPPLYEALKSDQNKQPESRLDQNDNENNKH